MSPPSLIITDGAVGLLPTAQQYQVGSSVQACATDLNGVDCCCGDGRTCESCCNYLWVDGIGTSNECVVRGSPGDELMAARITVEAWEWNTTPCSHETCPNRINQCDINFDPINDDVSGIKYERFTITLATGPVGLRRSTPKECEWDDHTWAVLARARLDSLIFGGCPAPYCFCEDNPFCTDPQIANFGVSSDDQILLARTSRGHWILAAYPDKPYVLEGATYATATGPPYGNSLVDPGDPNFDVFAVYNNLLYNLPGVPFGSQTYEIDTGCVQRKQLGRLQPRWDRLKVSVNVEIELSSKRCDANCQECV